MVGKSFFYPLYGEEAVVRELAANVTNAGGGFPVREYSGFVVFIHTSMHQLD